MTYVFFGVVLILAMGAIALVASGRGAPMVDDYDDRPDALVPVTGDLGPQDLRRVRFTLGLRGYRMSEVDALLSRLAAQLEAHQAWRPPAEPTSPDEGAGRHRQVDHDEPSVEPSDDRESERPQDVAPPG